MSESWYPGKIMTETMKRIRQRIEELRKQVAEARRGIMGS